MGFLRRPGSFRRKNRRPVLPPTITIPAARSNHHTKLFSSSKNGSGSPTTTNTSNTSNTTPSSSNGILSSHRTLVHSTTHPHRRASRPDPPPRPHDVNCGTYHHQRHTSCQANTLASGEMKPAIRRSRSAEVRYLDSEPTPCRLYGYDSDEENEPLPPTRHSSYKDSRPRNSIESLRRSSIRGPIVSGSREEDLRPADPRISLSRQRMEYNIQPPPHLQTPKLKRPTSLRLSTTTSTTREESCFSQSSGDFNAPSPVAMLRYHSDEESNAEETSPNASLDDSVLVLFDSNPVLSPSTMCVGEFKEVVTTPLVRPRARRCDTPRTIQVIEERNTPDPSAPSPDRSRGISLWSASFPDSLKAASEAEEEEGEEHSTSSQTERPTFGAPSSSQLREDQLYWSDQLTKSFINKGAMHRTTAEAFFQLGHAHLKLNDLWDSIQSFASACKIYRSLDGRTHLTAGRCLDAQGLAILRCFRQRKMDQSTCDGSSTKEDEETNEALLEAAHHVLQEAFAIRFHNLGVWHVDTVETYNKMASLYTFMGKLDEAAKACDEVLVVRRAIFGNDHPSVAISAQSLANVHRRLHQPKLALEYYQMALDILLFQNGSSSPAERRRREGHPTVLRILREREAILQTLDGVRSD